MLADFITGAEYVFGELTVGIVIYGLIILFVGGLLYSVISDYKNSHK